MAGASLNEGGNDFLMKSSQRPRCHHGTGTGSKQSGEVVSQRGEKDTVFLGDGLKAGEGHRLSRGQRGLTHLHPWSRWGPSRESLVLLPPYLTTCESRYLRLVSLAPLRPWIPRFTLRFQPVSRLTYTYPPVLQYSSMNSSWPQILRPPI